MSTVSFDSISDLRKGKYTWNIKVRVLRKWRYGDVQSDDKTVSPFNLLLLDDKDSRVHCLVGKDTAPTYESVFLVGKIYTISNFTVKDYTERDKPVPIELNHQIILSSYTKVEEQVDSVNLIANNAFDFYDLGDLEQMANQDKYLTDVIGVVQDIKPLRHFMSSKGKEQINVKLVITDGRSNANVTLWHHYALAFEKILKQELKQPLIIIISSAKIGYWQGTVEASTYFSHSSVYINYKHHSVTSLRKMLSKPHFTNYQLSAKTLVDNKIFTVAEVLKLTEKYAGVTVKKVNPVSNWFFCECTSCQAELEDETDKSLCSACNRQVVYADIKYRVPTICTDNTGTLAIVFGDRDVRRLIKKKAYDLRQETEEGKFPAILKNLQKLDLTVILKVSEDNVKNGSSVFSGTEVELGHENYLLDMEVQVQETMTPQQTSSTNEHGTTSSIELEHLTNLNIVTPTTNVQETGRSLPNMPSFNLFSDDED